MKPDEINDKQVLYALIKRQASALALSRELGLARSSIYSALVGRKDSLLSQGCVEKAGSEFRITKNGIDRHDFLAWVAREERARPADEELNSRPKTYALTHDFYDAKTKETLGFSFWLSEFIPTGITRHTSKGAVDGGEAREATRKELYRWLSRPLDRERLASEWAREHSTTVLTNRDYLAFAMLALVGAVLDQRRRLVAMRPQYFNDIVIVRSRHLRDLKSGELETELRRILHLRNYP